MAEISAAAVKALRDETGLPMMECKQALIASNGDKAAAIEELRKKGKKTMDMRSDRETSSGRVVCFVDSVSGVAAMIEVQCESAPVINNDAFIQLVKDLVQQLATGPGASTTEELLAQPAPSNPSTTLQQMWDDLTNRIREVFRLPRMKRIESACGAYAHHNGTFGVLVEVTGGTQQLANEVAMHVGAMAPQVLNIADLPQEEVDKEREILTAAAKAEGKPDNILPKMVEGRLKNFYAARVLTEQPFIKDDKKTVGQVAKEGKMEIKAFHLWKLGQS